MNERLLQALVVTLFKGPLSIKDIAYTIAEHTGESPESVRVVLHRHIEKLLEYRLLKKMGGKKVDITPFGALLLLIHSPSPLFTEALVHHVERRYPHLLKGFADLHFGCVVHILEPYLTPKNEGFCYEDSYVSICAKVKNILEERLVIEPNLHNLLRNVGSFGNKRVLGKIDFTSLESLLKSLVFNSNEFLLFEFQTLQQYSHLINTCENLEDEPCRRRIERAAKCVLKDECIEEESPRYGYLPLFIERMLTHLWLAEDESVKQTMKEVIEEVEKVLGFSLRSLEATALFALFRYAWSTFAIPKLRLCSGWFLINVPYVVEHGGILVQSYIAEIMGSELRSIYEWVEWFKAYREYFANSSLIAEQDLVFHNIDELIEWLEKAVDFFKKLNEKYGVSKAEVEK